MAAGQVPSPCPCDVRDKAKGLAKPAFGEREGLDHRAEVEVEGIVGAVDGGAEGRGFHGVGP